MEIKLNLSKKKISDVLVGDSVYCYDEFDNRFCVNKVSNTFTPTIKKQHQEKIIINNKETLYTSSIHPFFDNRTQKWVEAQEIENILGLDENGKELSISNDTSYTSESDKTFYDFTVDDYHNYFVGKNDTFVLTHNSATIHVPVWHQEIEDIIVLKNNKGTEDNRVRKLDYSIQLSKIFYERFIQNGEITLFSPHDVPGLYDVFGLPEFDALYVQYEKDPSIKKKVVNAQELIINILKERAETGRIYIMNIDHCNSHSSYKDQITMSNLCVAPETQVLTKNGYQTISEIVGKNIDVWNGKLWSNVLIQKTSDLQELIKVTIDGEEVECTPYHRFFVIDGKKYPKNKKVIEKRANELKVGDKLIKFDLPVIVGNLELENAYNLGMHSTLSDLSFSNIPNADYTIESRLKWFAGVVDSIESHTNDKDNKFIQLNSSNRQSLKTIKYMLQELGIDSEIKSVCENGQHNENNQTWEFTISNNELFKLCNLGFKNYLQKVKISENLSNKNENRFHTVEDISYTGRMDSTYCFTEFNRGMGMFNGFLLGNCQEITEPTTPIQHIDDDNEAEVATCILSAVNVGKIRSKEELEELCDLSVRALEEIIDYQGYPVKAAENFTKRRRSLGIGFIGLAHYMAKLGFKYDTQEAWDAMHQLSESFQYYLLKASNQIAKERGACEYFHRTKYSDGILPIDTYKKEVDEITSVPLQHDWESLRKSIVKYGIRHSTLSAQMPSESCLFWKHKIMTTEGEFDFHQLCEMNNLDWETIENKDLIGWHNLNKPIQVQTLDGHKQVDKIYYNGMKEVITLVMENGKEIKCTPTHKFLVKDEFGNEIWKCACDLTDEDDIIEF
jgi:ribonucleoside-diphosphate reductase alpha chain